MNAYFLRAFWVILASALFSSAVPGESPWQRHFPVLPHDHYQSLATDGTLFVAVGEFGNVFTSPDGEAWALVRSGDGRKLRHAAHGGGASVRLR